MIHFLLLPIGFVLGYFIAASAARFKLERLEALHEQELDELASASFAKGQREARAFQKN